MFFWAASFEKRACWNTSLSGYVRVEIWTVSPDDRRRDMSSKAAVVFPVPVSPFTRRSRVFRSSNFCNSGGKGISGDAPRSSFNIRSPDWREEETWAAIYHGRVLRCVLLCSPKVNRAARFIRWRTEHKKSSDDATFSEARRRGTRRLALRRPVGPTATSLVPSPPTRRESVRGDVRYVYSVIEPHAVRYNRGRKRWEFGRTDPDRGEHTPPTRFDAQRETAGGFRYQETKCVLVCT